MTMMMITKAMNEVRLLSSKMLLVFICTISLFVIPWNPRNARYAIHSNERKTSIEETSSSFSSHCRRLRLGSSASFLRKSLISLVPKLPPPPSFLRSQPPSLTTSAVALSASPSSATSVANETTSRLACSGVRASLTISTTSWSPSVPDTPSDMRTRKLYSPGASCVVVISGSADTPMRLLPMSPNARVLARPSTRSSPKLSVTNAAA